MADSAGIAGLFISSAVDISDGTSRDSAVANMGGVCITAFSACLAATSISSSDL